MRGSTRSISVGLTLLALAALTWVGHLYLSATGSHSWDSNASPPATVQLRMGQIYALSSVGGLAELTKKGLGTSLSCVYTGADGTDDSLDVTELSTTSGEIHRIATFAAPTGAPITISCTDLGRVFVDDAHSAPFDLAGLLVLATIGLGLFGALSTMSGLMDRGLGAAGADVDDLIDPSDPDRRYDEGPDGLDLVSSHPLD
jgi:hypothetical protein